MRQLSAGGTLVQGAQLPGDVHGAVPRTGQDTSTRQRDRDPYEHDGIRVGSNEHGISDSVSTVSAGSRQGAGQEVSGINHHTHNVEFYGRSSSVALLSQVQLSGGGGEASSPGEEPADDAAAIVTNLHNPAFSPPGGAGTAATTGQDDASSSFATSHYPQCRGFLQGFFSSIHYIHPIVDKSAFLQRCELLWSGKGEAARNSSFTALYYSILALGALVGVRDDEPIDGVGNLQWSRRFFDEARARCSKLGMVTDLDMVQCYIFMVWTVACVIGDVDANHCGMV